MALPDPHPCLCPRGAGFKRTRFRPNFDVYYFGLLMSLLIGFALFADVATRES